jgi:hypothetical protein
MRTIPHGFRGNPAWEAFELWADANFVGEEQQEDWQIFWECFLAGFEVGEAEGESV